MPNPNIKVVANPRARMQRFQFCRFYLQSRANFRSRQAINPRSSLQHSIKSSQERSSLISISFPCILAIQDYRNNGFDSFIPGCLSNAAQVTNEIGGGGFEIVF